MRVRVSHVKGGVGKRTRENNNRGEKIRRCLNTSKFGFFLCILMFLVCVAFLVGSLWFWFVVFRHKKHYLSCFFNILGTKFFR